jgi:multidrug resistance efflux pump
MKEELVDLARRARLAPTDRELGFLLVNETLQLSHYRQAALWLTEGGVWTLSGVVQVDANVPHAQWLEAVCNHLHTLSSDAVRTFTAQDLPSDLAAEWAQWWPEHALWLGSTSPEVKGAALFIRETPWAPEEVTTLQEWQEIWWHAFAAKHKPKLTAWRTLWQQVLQSLKPSTDQAWYRQRRFQLAGAVLAILLWPVRLTVLAPGELVPAHPIIVRAPLDGVIDVFHVQPNQRVKADQALFSFDEIVIQAKLDIGRQALATAETDYRQTTQMALTDAKFKSQLGVLAGKVEERRSDIEYLQEQLTRARVLAPQEGVVLMDDPSEWIGKPVNTGERILRIAALDDSEVEAWVSIADAISMEIGDSVTLYLSANPLSPVSAKLRYMSHEYVQRPDGTYAYRVRATLEDKTSHRIGLKGTAKLHGRWVPMTFWILRRPWATARAYLGW